MDSQTNLTILCTFLHMILHVEPNCYCIYSIMIVNRVVSIVIKRSAMVSRLISLQSSASTGEMQVTFSRGSPYVSRHAPYSRHKGLERCTFFYFHIWQTLPWQITLLLNPKFTILLEFDMTH